MKETVFDKNFYLNDSKKGIELLKKINHKFKNYKEINECISKNNDQGNDLLKQFIFNYGVKVIYCNDIIDNKVNIAI